VGSAKILVQKRVRSTARTLHFVEHSFVLRNLFATRLQAIEITSDYLASCPVEDRYIISKAKLGRASCPKALGQLRVPRSRQAGCNVHQRRVLALVRQARARPHAQTAEEKDREKALSIMHYVLATTANFWRHYPVHVRSRVPTTEEARCFAFGEKRALRDLPQSGRRVFGPRLEHKMKKRW